MERRVAVIGAGAAGLMAGIVAASLGCRVTMFEKSERVGRKILRTGNGKCNLSNRKMDVSEFYSLCPELVQGVLKRFSVQDTVEFFGGIGVLLRDKNGYLYPYSEHAPVILDVLRYQVCELGISLVCNYEIINVEKRNDGLFTINGNYVRQKDSMEKDLKQGKEFNDVFDKVIVACGSIASVKRGEGMSGYRIAESLGHRIVPLVPGLCKLRCREAFLKALAGVRCQAELTLYVNGAVVESEVGELQFTADCISGISVFQLSRTAAYALEDGKDVLVSVDFFPEMEDEEYKEFCRKRMESCGLGLGDIFIPDRYGYGEKTIEEFLTGMTHKKINQVLIRKYNLHYEDKINKIGAEKIWRLLMELRRFLFHVNESGGFENAQVCAGGVDLSGLSENLESLMVPGLYFAGEILDVDGRCGGYNLQWAWSSAYVAASGAVKHLMACRTFSSDNPLVPSVVT